MQESLVKYLAGLLDADGCLSFKFGLVDQWYNISLTLVLAASEAVDRHGFVRELPILTGMGWLYTNPAEPHAVIDGKHSRRQRVNRWHITKRADLEMLLPRLVKHMTIKAKHWQWMLDVWREKRGSQISAEVKEALVAASKESRRIRVGPIKPKNHPTWAWLAGYLDGDGTYHYRSRIQKNGCIQWQMYVSAIAHVNDRHVLDFLHNAFGGSVCYQGQSEHLVYWRRSLGYNNRSFAERFLPNLAKHSRLKRDKIDAILHHHRQRLSVPGTERRYCEVEDCGHPRYGRGLCYEHYLLYRRKMRAGLSDSLSAESCV